MSSVPIAFIAAPYGFGPTSKAIAISSHLPLSTQRDYFGDGPPLELARGSGTFSRCIKLDFAAPTEAVADILRNYRTLVFVNTARFLSAVSRRGTSVVFVDTLAWLRHPCPAGLPAISAYFAQRFFDHPFASTLASATAFRPTGAIVPLPLGGPRRPGVPAPKSPLVHCGGLCSPVMRPGASEAFVMHLCAALNQTGLSMRIILPRHMHGVFLAHATNRLSLVECSPMDVRYHIEGSEFALTTSGIEFTYESVLLRTPTLFLPPFNETQLQQLYYYRNTFIGCVPFELTPEGPCSGKTGLDIATAALQDIGMEGIWSQQFQSLGHFLVQTPMGEFVSGLLEQQRRGMATVGSDGAASIASYIVNGLGRTGMSIGLA